MQFVVVVSGFHGSKRDELTPKLKISDLMVNHYHELRRTIHTNSAYVWKPCCGLIKEREIQLLAMTKRNHFTSVWQRRSIQMAVGGAMVVGTGTQAFLKSYSKL